MVIDAPSAVAPAFAVNVMLAGAVYPAFAVGDVSDTVGGVGASAETVNAEELEVRVVADGF